MAEEFEAGYLPVLTAEDKAHLGGGEPVEKVEAPQDDAVVNDDDKPEPEAKADEPVEKDEKRHTQVSHAALEEERNRRKELAKERDALRDDKIRMEEKFRLLQEAWAPQKQDAPPPPKTDEDIFGSVDHVRAKADALEKQLNEQLRREQHMNARQDVQRRYSAAADEFKAEAPDFMDAYGHLMKTWHEELSARGVANHAEREQMIVNEELNIAYHAMQKGQNPAEIAYKMAKARGYAKKEAAPTPPPAAEKLAAIAASQDASKSLSAAGGSAGGQMTLERIARMSQDEFNAYVEKNPKTARRLMGG
jgi:hypothetical protein